MTYAVKPVENLFMWCGHEIYPMMMENENVFFHEIYHKVTHMEPTRTDIRHISTNAFHV